MTWGPEDWDGWLHRSRSDDTYGQAIHVRAMREILFKIPERARKRALAVDCEAHAYLLNDFADVELAGCAAHSAPPPVTRSDVALAVDPAAGQGIDKTLAFAHDGLIEGGIFVGSFPATHRREPVSLILGESSATPLPSRIHEVELQYRLRRTGFQGVRIRRFPAVADEGDTLICMAVRRASN